MTTITLEISDEQARHLAEDEERLNLPIQELAVQRLLAPWNATENQPVMTGFQEAMEYVFQKNSELYRRLA